MKLPIRKKYFDQIRSGKKLVEYRDAHLTFVCEETKRTFTKKIQSVALVGKPRGYDKVLEDPISIAFYLK